MATSIQMNKSLEADSGHTIRIRKGHSFGTSKSSGNHSGTQALHILHDLRRDCVKG